MSALTPYVLHAALEADLDDEAQCYHLRPLVDIELGDDTDESLAALARREGCDVDILINALVRAGMDAEARSRAQ